MNPDTINEWLNYSLITLGDVELRVSGVLAAFAALIITMLASRVLRRGLDALAGRRQSMNDASIYTIKRMVHYADCIGHTGGPVISRPGYEQDGDNCRCAGCGDRFWSAEHRQQLRLRDYYPV